MRLEMTGEADECTCADCRGMEVPQWLWRLGDRPDPAAELHIS